MQSTGQVALEEDVALLLQLVLLQLVGRGLVEFVYEAHVGPVPVS